MDDFVIRCDELIKLYDDETKIVSTNFNEKMRPLKPKNTIFDLYFY